MLIRHNSKPLAAISYNTQTYGQLCKFIKADEGEELVRIDPNDFLQNPSDEFQYINLVVKDFDQRKQISAVLDQMNLDRFTYIGEDSIASRFRVTDITVGQGCMLFPGVWMYTGSIGNDVIMHGLVKMAENVQVGNGCFFSGSITIAGGCTIGDWCFLGNNLFFIDNVSVCDNVKLLPGTNLRKNITQPGTYYNPYTYKIEKIVV
jgi:UDP-3-O-[3-hydroxymyristoyl] glucosamine N-acyltransferase